MARAGVRWRVAAGVAASLAVLATRPAGAQEPTVVRSWELRGTRFDFTRDGVWRSRVRAVAAARAAALARGDFRALNAPVQAAAPLPSAYAVTGTLNVPVILVRFQDTDTTTLQGDSATYTQVLFGTTPPFGRPYTVRTFYEAMSQGLFSMTGSVVGRSAGWIPLSKTEAHYTGPAAGCSPYGTCNGVWSNAAYDSLVNGLVEVIHRADSLGVDWSRFGYDPSTGVLDLVIFVQPNRDGACHTATNNHVWSHRGWLNYVGTGTPWPGHTGQYLRVSNYTIQSGVGGAQGCDTTQVMPVGTAAHETGHGLDLPDLYDTSQDTLVATEGIGEWGLMGSGNYARPLSPAFFDAWSRSYVGWTTVAPLTTGGAYTLGPVETGDTVFLLRPSGTNPRHEYFLLENRQGLLSDSALIARKGSPGLLVWHVDSTQLAAGWYPNTVNAGPVHGLTLVEADGQNNLLRLVYFSGSGSNRGDGGDPYPGLTGRTHLGNDPGSPSNALDAGSYAGFVLDSIAQLAPGGPIRFRLALLAALSVAASDTAARIVVRGDTVHSFRAYLLPGDTATVGIDSLQTNAAGTAEYRFAGWSDGGARTHLVTTTGSRDTAVTAALTRRFALSWSVTGPGTVSVAPASAVSGAWYADGDTVGLIAHPDPGSVFMGWTGSATSALPHLVLSASRPYLETATFSAAPLDSVVAQLLDGHGLDALQVVTLDFQGNQNGHFDLGDFLAWLDLSGTAISADLLARVFERTRP
jgi:M6 family metalloprotease-like protein